MTEQGCVLLYYLFRATAGYLHAWQRLCMVLLLLCIGSVGL